MGESLMKLINIIMLLLILFLSINIATADTNVSDGRIAWKGVNWLAATWDSKVDASNIWIDDSGNLHQVLRKINGKYKGSVLESTNTVKYGKFTWETCSTSLNFDPKSVVGFYTYKSPTSEIDIELNEWPGYPGHLWYSNQPATKAYNPENTYNGVLDNNPHLNDKNIKYVIDWHPKYVVFDAIDPDGNTIQHWNYTLNNPPDDVVPNVEHTICMGILPQGGTTGPTSGKQFELVLSDFKYEPLDVEVETPPEENQPPTEEETEVPTITPVETWTPQTVPIANFTASKINGTSPLTVKFTDTSTGNPTYWVWHFGDGGYSLEQNPTHTYNYRGQHDVILTIFTANGIVQKRTSGFITVK